MSFEREGTWPDVRNSQALVLREPRGRFSSHEHPHRKLTYDDGIRVRGYDDSRSPSPNFDPYDTAKRKLSLAPPLAPPTLSKSFDSWNKPWHEYKSFSSRPPKSFSRSKVATQSRVPAPRSAESSDDDEDDVNFPENAKDESDDDADLIAKTLSRYTTFKVDEDVTAGARTSPPPAADAPMSPTRSGSRSSTPPRYLSTLEDMKSSLEKMQITKNRAEEHGDLKTATDLRYYEIPEIQRRIEKKEDEARMEAEAKAEKIEIAGRAYSVQPNRAPVRLGVASPITAEDVVASAQDSLKKTETGVPTLRVQWRGIHDNSPNRKQNDRSGERTSRLLKKMKSTDDLRSEDLADQSFRPAGSANHVEDRAAQITKDKKNQRDDVPIERLSTGNPRSRDHNTRRPNRSPSLSESEREPVRRADTQLYEADSEGSGREEIILERRDTWRRPTVEDEIVVEEEVD